MQMADADKAERKKAKLAVLVASYCAVSSTLLIINKAALVYYPYPNMVLLLQLASSALVAFLIEVKHGTAETVLTWDNIAASVPVSASFFLGVFTSINALKHINVDTMIVVKTCTPVMVAVAEWGFRDYALPEPRTWLSLVAVVVSTTASLSMHISDITAAGAVWVAIWFVVVVFNMIYSAHYASTVKLTANGRVLCENLISCFPVATVVLAWEAMKPGILDGLLSFGGWWVALSCLVGFGMSWFGWALRQNVSALTYTVIGVLNKLFTVAMNHSIWDRHGSVSSSGLLCMGIMAGAFYRPPLPSISKRRRLQKIAGLCMAALALATMVLTGVVLGNFISGAHYSMSSRIEQHIATARLLLDRSRTVAGPLFRPRPFAIGV
jgi:hypothetical protein